MGIADIGDALPGRGILAGLTDTWHRFAALTSLEKASFFVFGAVMHLFVVGQFVLVVWLLLIGFRSQR